MRNKPVSQRDSGSGLGDDSPSDSIQNVSKTDDNGNPGVRVWRALSPGPNDWHPEGSDNTLLHASHKRNSSTAVSSLIQDNGDGQQLSDNAEEREGVFFAPSSDLFKTGAQFSPDDTRSIKSKISEFSDSEPHETSLSKGIGSHTSARGRHGSLQEAISEARIEPLTKDNRFLPLDSLGTLITLQSIESELAGYELSGYDDLGAIAKDVLMIKPETKPTKPARPTKPKDGTTRRKIFAILVMMRKSYAIVDVLREAIYDDDLPFRIGKSAKTDVYRKAQEGEPLEPILFFRKWKIDERETFEYYQWQMTAPYFRLGWRPMKKVHHYDLEPRVVLPFIEETLKDDSSGHSVDFSGGTSTVRKLKIHQAHHNCYKKLALKDTNPYFAVKTLRLREELAKEKGKEVNREALALKRFVDKDHDHLIRLLATFTYKDQYNLILPCADGNLQDFWKKHYPDPNDLPRDHELARWLVEQLHGLAQAVQSIHMAPVDDANSGNLSEEDRAKQHGRHGDLKPENILWFKDSEIHPGRSSMGVLKISDFGFADFHRTHSVNIISLSSIGGVTPTYRAPECDLAPQAPKGSLVSPAYDIWSFGCVFLEFLTWYLLGWDGVDAFSTRRKDESNSIVAEDNFFNSSDDGPFAKRSKRSVAENFKTLKERPDCSDFLLDLLDYIQGSMLRMKPQSRASCDHIVAKLKMIKRNCEVHRTYCTERIKEIKQTPTDLSEVTVQYSLPEPGELKDPINVVIATNVDHSDTPVHDNGMSSMLTTSYTPSGESRESETESTPLLSDSVLRVNASSDQDGTRNLGASLSRGTINWALGIFRACCCLVGDDVIA